MAKLMIDSDKYGDQPSSPVVEAYHSAIKDLVRRRLDEVGGDWASFVFDKSYDLIGAKEFAAVEKKLLATGHRFDWSAMISVRERPEAYKPAAGAARTPRTFSFEHAEAVVAPADAEGREQRGIGDNVVKYREEPDRHRALHPLQRSRAGTLTNGVPAGNRRDHRRQRRHADGADPRAVQGRHLRGRHGALASRASSRANTASPA